MQFLFNVLFWCVMMLGVFAFLLNGGKGRGIVGSMMDGSGMTKADEDSRAVGVQLRRNDSRIEDDGRDLEDKMARQRDAAQKARDRMQTLQDRNAAQKDRLQAQMDRLKNR